MNEQFDVGRNRGSAVSPEYAGRGPFAFGPALRHVRVDLPAARDIPAGERARIAMATH